METAMREAHEESGLSFTYIDEKVFEDKYEFTRNDQTITTYVYYFIGIAKDNNAKIDPVEIKDACRLPLHEVKKKLTFYNDRQLRNKVFTYLLGQ
jgi:ADP-ribose pyrophosphatase YjhB (NUDIX family)